LVILVESVVDIPLSAELYKEYIAAGLRLASAVGVEGGARNISIPLDVRKLHAGRFAVGP
jgi:hypothetical protein